MVGLILCFLAAESQARRMAQAAQRVLVAVADGSEDIETVATIDVLRRAGAEVTVASVEAHNTVTLARGCKLVADANIQEVKERVFDAIALPGGMPGAEHLRDSAVLAEMLKKQQREERVPRRWA